MRDPGEFLDKESPIQGPWCRFRREARARERHHTAVVDSLKVLDLKRPIREADIALVALKDNEGAGGRRPRLVGIVVGDWSGVERHGRECSARPYRAGAGERQPGRAVMDREWCRR